MSKNDQDTFAIENFLEDDELSFLKKLCDKVPNKKNSGEEFLAYTNGFAYELLPITIRQKIQEKIGANTVTVSMILKEYHPWSIHSDYSGKDDKHQPSWAVLIPITFSRDTHTVVFPQKEKISFNSYKNSNKETNYQYTQQQIKLLSHISESDLNYVSDPVCYKWQPGKLIAWKRDRLHTSDNFKFEDDDHKVALVIFFCNND